MKIFGRTQLFAALAVGGLLLGTRSVEARYRHFDPPPPPPPPVIPPPVTPPPAIVTDVPPDHCHHDPTPPGGTQNAPEPATLLSGLLGAGLLGLFGRRRRKQDVVVD